MDWYLGPLRRYAEFHGRSSRKEYWLFLLGQVIFGLIAALVAIELYGVFLLATIIPSLAVYVRRLHDTNRSGWWVLIGLIPLVGNIVLFIFLVTRGTSGDNDYGPDPLQPANAAVATGPVEASPELPDGDPGLASPTGMPPAPSGAPEVAPSTPKHRPIIKMKNQEDPESPS